MGIDFGFFCWCRCSLFGDVAVTRAATKIAVSSHRFDT